MSDDLKSIIHGSVHNFVEGVRKETDEIKKNEKDYVAKIIDQSLNKALGKIDEAKNKIRKD